MSSNSSVGISIVDCGMKYFLTGNFVAYALVLPVFLSVVREGFRRGRRSGSVSTAMGNMDIFAYNMVALELLGTAGVCLYMWALYTSWYVLSFVVIYVLNLISAGPILFHVLTCVDCYLAVLRPVTYLRLRSRAGVRLRNAVTAAAWMLSLVVGVLRSVFHQSNLIYVSLVTSALIAVSFCCTAVLRALIRPRPGDGGGAGARDRVDQSKRRALHTMTAVLAALLTRFTVNLVTEMLRAAQGNAGAWTPQVCVASMTAITFHLPSSLVLPLLFLQRARKFPFSDKTARKFSLRQPPPAMASYNQTKHPPTVQN